GAREDRAVGEDRYDQLLQGLRRQRAMKLAFLLVFVSSILGTHALAQSPNTASIVVVVSDETNAVVPGADVSVVNAATGAARHAVSGSNGTVTISALPLTGTYTVSASLSGFTPVTAKDIHLRAGETATIRLLLRVGIISDRETVTVYGTADGVRADP